MSANGGFTSEEDRRLAEHIDFRLWIQGVPEEHWEELKALAMRPVIRSYGITIENIIHLSGLDRFKLRE